jgi:hypothetical protein
VIGFNRVRRLSEWKTNYKHNLQKYKMEDKYMKSSLIKITKSVVALIAIVAAGGLLAGAFHSQTATAQLTTMSQICSNATLLGDYAFRVSGEIFIPGTNTIAVYRDGVAMTHFNGMGGLTQEDWLVGNGVSDGPPTPGFHDNETGTYAVNADCTGHGTINFPIPPGGTSGAVINLKFVLGESGRVIHTIVTSLRPPNTPPGTTVPANIHSDAEKL